MVLLTVNMTECCGRRRFVGAWFCLLAIAFISIQLVEVGDAQAYHFSKGWMPGRKRSGADSPLTAESASPGHATSSVFGELDRQSAAEVCAIKSRSYRLALDILKARHHLILLLNSYSCYIVG